MKGGNNSYNWLKWSERGFIAVVIIDDDVVVIVYQVFKPHMPASTYQNNSFYDPIICK